jgi:hypothetical protein
MAKVKRTELRRLREQVEEMPPPPPPDVPRFQSRDDFLDFLAEHLPDWLQEQVTGEREGFARRLDAYDGRLSKAPCFMEAFRLYAYQQYEGYAFNLGNLWLFIPGDSATRYEQARRDVVRMMREQLLATGDGLDEMIASVLCDESLAELGRRWPRVRLETLGVPRP